MPDVDELDEVPPARSRELDHRHEHPHEEPPMSGIQDIADKININMPGADGGGMNGILAALMAGKDSGGMKDIWPLALLFLLRRGGLEGDVGAVAAAAGVDRCEVTAILSKLGDIQGAIPLSTAQIQTFLESQTGQISNQISQQTLFMSQGFANVGDKIQNGNTAILAAAQLNTANILTAIQSVKDQGTAFRVSDLERQLTVAELRGQEDRLTHRFAQTEVNVTQNVNQQQQQQQFQTQLGNLSACLQTLMAQNSRQGQDIVNLGTMTASGTQAAANTQVR